MMDEGKMTTPGGAAAGTKNTGRDGEESPDRSAQQGQGEVPCTQNEKEQEAVMEAVLFTMGRSVELRQLAAAIGQDKETAQKAVERLKARYEKNKNCGMQIIALDDSYQMCTKSKYYENLIRVAATPKKQVLTEVVLETLSIIAYKQPVTKLEIEKIRGVKTDHAVNRLVEYNLVYEVGRLDAPGRPALFATTEEFLRRFGVGSADDLPSMNPERAEEIKAEVEEELKLKLGDLAGQGEGETGAAGPEVLASEAGFPEELALEAESPEELALEAASPGEQAPEAPSPGEQAPSPGEQAPEAPCPELPAPSPSVPELEFEDDEDEDTSPDLASREAAVTVSREP